jgi:hypothetical protein
MKNLLQFVWLPLSWMPKDKQQHLFGLGLFALPIYSLIIEFLNFTNEGFNIIFGLIGIFGFALLWELIRNVLYKYRIDFADIFYTVIGGSLWILVGVILRHLNGFI